MIKLTAPRTLVETWERINHPIYIYISNRHISIR